jgi:hypothetical protein
MYGLETISVYLGDGSMGTWKPSGKDAGVSNTSAIFDVSDDADLKYVFRRCANTVEDLLFACLSPP